MGFLHTPKKIVQGKLFYFPVQADLSPIHFWEIQRCFILEREQAKNPSSKVSLKSKDKASASDCCGSNNASVPYTELQI